MRACSYPIMQPALMATTGMPAQHLMERTPTIGTRSRSYNCSSPPHDQSSRRAAALPRRPGARARAMAMAACTLSASPGGAVTTRQAAVRCSSRPQGEPSGVCTGHMKPQESGSSLRTAVVRSSAKYAPRWMQRKCDRYLRRRRARAAQPLSHRVARTLVAAHMVALIWCSTHSVTLCVVLLHGVGFRVRGAPEKVELLGHDGEAGRLAEVNVGAAAGAQVARVQQVLHLRAAQQGSKPYLSAGPLDPLPVPRFACVGRYSTCGHSDRVPSPVGQAACRSRHSVRSPHASRGRGALPHDALGGCAAAARLQERRSEVRRAGCGPPCARCRAGGRRRA